MNPNFDSQNQTPSQPTNGMSGLDYLNSISTPTSTEPVSTKPIIGKKWVILLVSGAVIIAILAALIVIVYNRDKSSELTNEKTTVTAEEHSQEETLNQTLASRIRSDPHRDYISPNEYSPNYESVPAEIIIEWGINVDNPDFSSTGTSVPAMNSNILNYYLDQNDTIVAIVEPSGISSLGKKTTILFVYASEPQEYDFLAFDPSDLNADGSNKDDYFFPEQTAIHFSRSELFNQLTDKAEFYILKKTSTEL